MRRQLFAAAALTAGLSLTAWMLVAPNALIRYPDDLDQRLTYRGVASSVASPDSVELVSRDLTITRHIWVAASTHDTATIREDITTRIGDEVREQSHGYVIDRRTMKTQRSEANFAFGADNPVNRHGSYGPTLPMNLDTAGKFSIWNNDTGTSYNLLGDGTTTKAHGLTLVTLRASTAQRPVTAAYRDFLDLPTSTTLENLAKIGNIDLRGVLDTLADVVDPVVMSEVVAATTAPVPLSYYLDSIGEVGVEAKTGGIVDIVGVSNHLTVSEDLTALKLPTILADYSLDPVVRTVLAQLDEFAVHPPITAMRMQYAQTPTSVRAAAAVARSLRDDARRVTVDVPRALAAVTALLLVGALVPPRRRDARMHVFHHRRSSAEKAA